MKKLSSTRSTRWWKTALTRNWWNPPYSSDRFYRKVTNTPYPYGIKLLLRLSGDWFLNGDPVSALEFEALILHYLRNWQKGRF
ncbi:MAG: hypothetical protein R2875_07780 [Desulfobacterales bacterium]